MYLPVIYYPIQDDDRATGFLLPTYGVVDAARPGPQQRVLLGDRTQPGRDVLPRLVHAGPARAPAPSTAMSPARARTGTSGSTASISTRRSSRRRRLDDDPAGADELPGSAAPATRPSAPPSALHAAHRLLLEPRHAAALSAEPLSGVERDAHGRSRGVTGVVGRADAGALFQRIETFADADTSQLYGSTPRLTAASRRSACSACRSTGR